MSRLAAVVLPLLLLLACATPEPVDFSKSNRFADDQGIVTDIDFESVQLDGSRKHTIDPEVQSFSTYNGKVTPLLSWKQKYVHVGLDENKAAIWISGIGVVDRTADPPIVRYANGLLKSIDSRRNAIFADGTVIKLSKDLEIPPDPEGHRLNIQIDPVSHEALSMRGTAAPPD